MPADGQPTFTVHIGTHKTGSTSIQLAAFANRDRLTAAGTHLVRTATKDFTSPHNNLAYELLDRSEFAPEQGTLAEAEREIAESGAPNALITSESLCGQVDFAPKYERLRAMSDRLGRRLKVVVYLREQLSYLNSIYAFRARRFSQSRAFEPFVRRTARHSRLHYPALLDQWAVAADELVVVKFGSDVIDRFFRPLGVEIEGEFHANTSVGPKSVEALRTLHKNCERTFGEAEYAKIAALYRKREDRFRRRTDQWGWNGEGFWGFEDGFTDEIASLFDEENRDLFERYGVDFRRRGPNRRPNAFDPERADPVEREDFERGKAELWSLLQRMSKRAEAKR